MSLIDLNPASSADEWDRKWVEIFDHYQHDRRHAHYINALLERGERSVLELAAGSFRDMASLRSMGVDCSGMDFSMESVRRAQQAFPQFAAQIAWMSAFDMPLPERAFDVTYHNGFWVLFSDDQIQALAREQARVTVHRMIATVHNRHNARFVAYFDTMKRKDPLYDIRFFSVAEITAHMQQVCDEVVVIPVGKYKRRHEDALIRWGLTQPWLLRAYLKASGHRLLETSERLLCIGRVR
ncbi:class I SAM-dependent methyltransferase [Xanthomonas campestris pv. raphani]|uniref:class I SAM-dependent methyltransferase n=1 Tax=Xanthomonas campestris TaxID=339 RepID=UPI002B23571E|nr:class I SAM-dependent methyltransferase [Xanthomonas campestris]MEA9884258.1 class I SAM-dependent methyltransferase [Xanthomonas campestris pv. raphani]MEB2181597.1 class I SAM-dependent methyltransferase [Xanthomonas campestris pv. campestris]